MGSTMSTSACCSGSNVRWPSNDYFNDHYELATIVHRGIAGYTSLIISRNPTPRKEVVELTLRDVTQTLYECTVDTTAMFSVPLDELSHKNLLAYSRLFVTPSLYAAVSAYCEGGSLADFLEERKRCVRFGGKNLRVYETHVVGYVQQVAAGLEYLHGMRLCHRNVKLSTIHFADVGRSAVKLGGMGYVIKLPGPGEPDVPQPPCSPR